MYNPPYVHPNYMYGSNPPPRMASMDPTTGVGGPLGINPSNYTYPASNGFKVIPVASYDEAKAVPTNFMGDTLVLTDFSHGMIYTKFLDINTGSSIFQMYKLHVPETTNVPEYNVKEEIESLKKECAYIRKELGLDKEEAN